MYNTCTAVVPFSRSRSVNRGNVSASQRSGDATSSGPIPDANSVGSPGQVPPELVQSELERILESSTFGKSPRLSRFLRFTVEQSLQGHSDRLKEYSLGVDVFDRGTKFDPQADPIVRVQAGRLRNKLQQYYDSEGQNAALVFELPKGAYIPSFRRRVASEPAIVPATIPVSRLTPAIWLAVSLMVVAAIIYATAHATSRNRPDAGTATAGAGNQGGSTVSSIAVLPFEDRSLQKDKDYFCDGMTETLIDTLTKVEGLRVAARISTFAFRNKHLELATVGQKLHVGAVLEGNVRQDGQRLRVSVQLVNVSDGLNIWSEVYDRDIAEVFAVQDEIAQAIVNALQNRFSWSIGSKGQLAKAYTRNPEAYTLYLKGHYLLEKMTPTEINKGMSYLGDAIHQEPSFALAYAGMAEGYNLLGNSNLAAPRDVMPGAKTAAMKALSLDESLAEAHAALGLIESTYDWDWKSAEREFKRAIELNPSYVPAYLWYGLTCLASTGRMSEALMAIRKARDLDPLSPITNTNLASVLLKMGRYDEAIRIYKETIDLEPSFFWAYRDLGLALYEKHSYREAIDALRNADSISRGNPGVMAALGYCYGALGQASLARGMLNQLQELSKRTYVPPYHIAAVYAGLSQPAQALEWLDRAYQDRSSWMNGIKVDPLFGSLHADPRFASILKKMGLA